MRTERDRSDSNYFPAEYAVVLPYEELADPPPPEPKPKGREWGKRLLCLAGSIGSVFLNVANYSRWTNALGSFGAGFFAQTAIQVGHEGETLARIRQCSSTIFGQMALFALSQAFANVDDPTAQNVLPQAIIAQFGMNAAIAGWWLVQEGGIRIEGKTERGRATLNYSECISQKGAHGAKFTASLAAGAGYFLLSDPILQGLCSFVGSFFMSQIMGERTIDWIGNQVQATSSIAAISHQTAGSKYRTVQTALTTLAYVAQPLSFTPWIKPDASERIKELIFVGVALGFCNGIIDQSQKRRIKAHPIRDLEEFRKLTAPEKPLSLWFNPTTLRYLADRTWKVAIPILAVSGMTGFTLWQEMASGELDSADSRIALGAMLGGFLTTYPAALWIDANWSVEHRNRFTDNMMVSLWASPRIFGLNPLFIYYMGTNALPLASSSLDRLENPYYVATSIVAYAAYGAAMGRELAITSSERIGNAQMKYPGMFMIDATLTCVNRIKGVI